MLLLLTPAFLLEDSPRAGAFIVYVVVVYPASAKRRRRRGRDLHNILACSAPGSLDTSLSHAAGLIEIAACHA